MKRKLLLFIVMLGIAMGVTAQTKQGMEYVKDSLKPFSVEDRMTSGSDMGSQNMTAQSMIWPKDADGEETTALLVVYFENMAPEDIDKVMASLSGGKIVAKTESKNVNGIVSRRFFIPEGKNIDVDLSHARFGTTRIPGCEFKRKNIYKATVRNAATTTVTISSNPPGATVTFDGCERGITPVSIPEVYMGPHNLALSSPNPAIANPMKETAIEVSSTQTVFDYNLRKTRTMTFSASPDGAMVKVEKDGKELKSGHNTIVIDDLPYDTYTVTGTYNAIEVKTPVDINDDSKDLISIDVIGSKSIAFQAHQNNAVVRGATVNINGAYAGQTPMEKVLKFGSYDIEMSYGGLARKGHLKVNEKTPAEFMLKLPARRSVDFNPFEIDYVKHAWGLAANYINRYYNFKVNGKSVKYNWLGEEGTTNGFQVGLVYQPYFGYGQGLSTGVFFQGSYGSSADDDISYSESAIYIPLQYQFRLPLHRNFSVFVNGGAAMTCGISNNWTLKERADQKYDIGYGYNEEYETYSPERVDFSLIFGGGIQFKHLQIEAKYSTGLTDHEIMYTVAEGDKVSYKSAFWSVGLALMF